MDGIKERYAADLCVLETIGHFWDNHVSFYRFDKL